MMRWLLRAWRWKVEIRPVENLLFYAALYAVAVWLPDRTVGAARSVMFVLIVMCAAVVVAVFASARRRR